MSVPRRRLRPSVSCRVDRLRIAGVEVLVFNVPIAPEAVMVTGNGFPYRVGNHVTREPQEVINERKQAYRRVGYEQRFRADATLDSLDLELAQSFLARTPVGKRPILEALRYYGLIEHDARDWRVTNAALLLFAKEPALRWHPRAGLRLFRVAGRSRQHGRKRNVTQVGRADPPLAKAVDEAHRLARQQIRRSERLNGLPDYVRTSCSGLHTGTGTGFGPLTWRRAAHSDRFGARCTLPTAQSTRSIEQDELGT